MEMITLLNKCQFIRQEALAYLKGVKMKYNHEEFNNKNPLAPFIGTVCDQQINADVAWKIPYYMSEWLESEGKELKASVIRRIGKPKLQYWLAKHMSNKWPSAMKTKDREKWLDDVSEYLIRTCDKIDSEYQDDPDMVFVINRGNLSVPLVYFLLRQFSGVGPKKASMIARDFGRGCGWLMSVNERIQKTGIIIKIEQPHFTEVPIDVHVKRVLQRIGFARYNQPQDFQNLARLIYAENPGLVDDFIWNLGRDTCKTRPNCSSCSLTSICGYYNR